jgi:hypothetical protein
MDPPHAFGERQPREDHFRANGQPHQRLGETVQAMVATTKIKASPMMVDVTSPAGACALHFRAGWW